MDRSCSKCGTVFEEKITIDIGIIDKIPECWANSKENGICIHCCNCKH